MAETARRLPFNRQFLLQQPNPQVDVFDRWLKDLKESAVSVERKKVSPKAICYILVLQPQGRADGGPVLKSIIVRILKKGGYSLERACSYHEMANATAQYVTDIDKSIALLRSTSGWHADYSLPEDREMLDLLLRKVISTGRAFLDDLTGPSLLLGEPRQARLGWRVGDDGVQNPAILVGDDATPLSFLAFPQPWYLNRASGEMGPILLDAPLGLAKRFLAGPAIAPSAVTASVEKLKSSPLAHVIEPPRAVSVRHLQNAAPTPCLRLIHHMAEDEAEHRAFGLLHFEYEGFPIEYADRGADTVRGYRDKEIWIIHRSREQEKALFARVQQLTGFIPYLHDIPGVPRHRTALTFFSPNGVRMAWLDFLHRHAPVLREEGWRIDVDPDFAARHQFATVDDDPVEAEFQEEEAGGWWFSLDLGIMIEGQRVPLLPLLVEAIRRVMPFSADSAAIMETLAGQEFLYVDLPDGRIAPLPFERVRDILSTLVELFDHTPLNEDGTLPVSIDLVAAIARIESVTKLRWMEGQRLRAIVDKLSAFSGIAPVEPPAGLHATLRPYQQQGVAWLQFLREYNLAGILADDMGLGKTVQALASLLIEKEAGRMDRPCLVICPTSLIPNWEAEAARYAPGLKVLPLQGPDRAQFFDQIETVDVVLSTYPLLPRDQERLLPVEWHMVILDEAQAIKNPTARATQLVCELKARHRLCMTGTPVENHLGEAWSHFSFLLPGMLGDAKRFNRLFRHPIEKQGDSERQIALARRLKPFILRRTKSEVLKDLPPKTEILHHVELDGPQRDFYETLRLAMHEKVRRVVSEQGFNRSRIVILDALLKLRQACCDPRLVKLQRGKKPIPSAKLISLMEMLPQMIEEGRKILLFSQFTSMLDLIKLELEREKIRFVELRGDTVDRRTPVQKFQNGDVPLFLISLKAGGTGLNLTAADTVIHYDPWWNPAVEAQATDRAHRIGQDKNVFVYKMIARGTVEERILELQNRKRAIGAAILSENADAAQELGRDDLDFLFQDVS